MLQDLNSSIISNTSDGSGEPEFLKKYAHSSPSPLGDAITIPTLLTHDVIGKPLKCFMR
jgi:hypothetical protein